MIMVVHMATDEMLKFILVPQYFEYRFITRFLKFLFKTKVYKNSHNLDYRRKK